MRFEYLIGIRYLRARRRERFVSMIAVISLTGVMLGTFALTVALSIMSGFQEDLRNRLLAFTPEITIERADGGVWDPVTMQNKIKSLGGIVASAPYVSSQVMIVSSTPSGTPGYVEGGILRGVVARNNPVLTQLQNALEVGSLDSLDTAHQVTIVDQGQKRQVNLPGAIIGRSLATELGLEIGDPIILISPASLSDAMATPRLKRLVLSV